VPNTASPALQAQRLEVCVFLFLIVPSMVLSFFVVKQGGMSFGLVSVATILRDLSLVALILFFLWRNGEAVERIGWTGKNAWKDIGLGFVLFVPMYYGAALIESALHTAGFTIPSTPLPSFLAATGLPDYLLACVLVVVVAWAEETIFRGYLMLRFAAAKRAPQLRSCCRPESLPSDTDTRDRRELSLSLCWVWSLLSSTCGERAWWHR